MKRRRHARREKSALSLSLSLCRSGAAHERRTPGGVVFVEMTGVAGKHADGDVTPENGERRRRFDFISFLISLFSLRFHLIMRSQKTGDWVIDSDSFFRVVRRNHRYTQFCF